MSHISDWMREIEASRVEIKRWLSQTCVGYQINGERQCSVWGGQVEMEDGSIRNAWLVQDDAPLYQGDFSNFRVVDPAFEKPRIDIESK